MLKKYHLIVKLNKLGLLIQGRLVRKVLQFEHFTSKSKTVYLSVGTLLSTVSVERDESGKEQIGKYRGT